MCRWLLLAVDRLPTQELVITQELIAIMLGVSREGITEAAGNLQRAGLVSYRRGHITVLDRPGLKASTCECYYVVKKEFQRLQPRENNYGNCLLTPYKKGLNDYPSRNTNSDHSLMTHNPAKTRRCFG